MRLNLFGFNLAVALVADPRHQFFQAHPAQPRDVPGDAHVGPESAPIWTRRGSRAGHALRRPPDAVKEQFSPPRRRAMRRAHPIGAAAISCPPRLDRGWE